MKELLDIIFPTLSDELIIVISLIIGLLVTASLILFLVKKISPKTNISELSARTRSWWIMAGMFIGAVFISYNISYFFLAFLSFIAFRELYSVLGFREADRGALFWVYIISLHCPALPLLIMRSLLRCRQSFQHLESCLRSPVHS